MTATVTATAANSGERWRTSADESCSLKYSADVGERPRLKTTKVQAFGGSNPSPSVFGFRPSAAVRLVS